MICLPVPRALVFMALSLLKVKGISLAIHCQYVCLWGLLRADPVTGIETGREAEPVSWELRASCRRRAFGRRQQATTDVRVHGAVEALPGALCFSWLPLLCLGRKCKQLSFRTWPS